MINTETARNTYTGNNSTAAYDYDFKIFDETHLAAVIRTPAGAVTELVLDTDFSITGVGEEDGGTITLIDGGQAWIDGDGFLDADMELTIYRSMPLKQTSDFANQTDFYPENHEEAFDMLVMMIQQLQEQINRCVKVSVEDFTEELILPSVDDRASLTFGFDAYGLPVAE